MAHKRYQPPSREEIAKFEKLVREDIFWVVKYGPGFDPHQAAEKNGEWHGPPGGPYCASGVCAIGAFCVHRQPKVHTRDNCYAVAKVTGLSHDWIAEIFDAVSNPLPFDSFDLTDECDRFYLSAQKVAHRLLAYGNKLNASADELRDEAAIEAQEQAEVWIRKGIL